MDLDLLLAWYELVYTHSTVKGSKQHFYTYNLLFTVYKNLYFWKIYENF
jgi:hypothetical protein